MKYIDKNDVDISKLFNWGGKLDITDSSGEVILTAYLRVIGDAEVNRARVYSLRKSSELRRRLKDQDSDEHIAYVPDIETVGREAIVNNLLLVRVRDITENATANLELKMPIEPDVEASLEEQEEYQKQLDEWPSKVDKEVEEKVNKAVEDERKRYESLSDSELEKEFAQITIARLCEGEMYQNFNDMCVYFASHSDENYKNKLFKSVEEFKNLPTQIKEKFSYFYSSLVLDVDNLKK